MREIKFRAWDKMTGMLDERNGSNFELEVNAQGQVIPLNKLDGTSVILMQYTGLKDKNGKEIYEGDIVCVFDEAVVPITDEGQGPTEPCNHLVAVEMKNGVWGFEIPTSDFGEVGWYGLHYWNTDINNEGYEIIGNIYEDSELIKK